MQESGTGCEVFVPSPREGVGVIGASYYCAGQGVDLVSLHSYISRSDTADVAYRRRSVDNGRTWSAPETWATQFQAPGGTGRRHPRGGYVDPPTGRFVETWTQGVLPTDNPLEGMRHWTLFYSVSEDGGRTEIASGQIIQQGEGFDAAHPLPGVTVGRNCVMMGDLTCRPITLADGTILLPAQSTPTGPDGDYCNPGGGLTYTDALVLRAKWTTDGRLAWRASDRVMADPNRTTRGLIEPTLAELPDGRILMVMRGSNQGRPELPGYKWFSVSRDNGATWSTAAPWTFADGGSFYSPSACSQLIAHSSGRLYWMGNICAENANGNAPRYPIVLAEVDRATGLPLRGSLRPIDGRRATDSPHLTLSNFYVREDRETGDLLLHLTRFFADPLTADRRDWTSNAMLYRIGMAN